MEDRDTLTKRKRSDEGLLGLLGTYASDEEELEVAESIKRQRSTEGVDIAVLRAQTQAEEPLVDLAAALTTASQRLEEAQLEEASKTGTGSLREEDQQEQHTEIAAEENGDADLCWLPPELAKPPPEPCPREIQDKVTDYILKQEATGTTISSSLRSLSGYRNPDFLQHCVVYDNISEYGSCYPAEIFDPTNLPPEDYYDRLAVEWQQHSERQRADRARSQKVDFTKGSTEGISKPLAAGLSTTSVAAQLVSQAKDKRSSKWDSKR